MILNLDEIEKALEDGTPTPWSEKAVYLLLRHGRKDVGGWDDEIKDDEFMPDEDDAHLIAHAPEWLRLLVGRVRKLERLEMAADYVKFYKDGAFGCIEAGNKKGFLSNIKHMQTCLTQLCEMVDNEE